MIIKKEIAKGMGLTLIKKLKNSKSNLDYHKYTENVNIDEAAKNSLLPQVLASGCEKYPSMKELSDRLDDLYGAALAAEVLQKEEKER